MPSQVQWMLLVVFVDIVGIAMVAPILPTIGKELGLSHTMFGFVGSFYGLAQAFSSPVMGAISDARGRKGVFLISLVGAALAYLTLGMALTYNAAWLLGVSRVTVGLVKQTMTIAISFITDETEPEARTSAIATLFSITNLAFILGAPFGGILSQKTSTKYPVLISAALYALAFLVCKLKIEDKGGSLGTKQVCPSLAAKGLKPSQYANKKAPHALPSAKEGAEAEERKPILQSVVQEFTGLLEDMWTNETIRKIGVAAFMSTLAVVVIQTSFTSVVVNKFDLTTREASYLVSYTALLNALWMFALTERVEKALRSFNIFPVSALLSGGALIVQAKCDSLKPVMLCMLVGSLGDALFKVFLSSVFTKLYEAEIGAAQGLFGNIEALCRVAAPAIAGVLLDAGGLSMPWTFAGALNIVVAAYCHIYFSDLDSDNNEEIRLQEKRASGTKPAGEEVVGDKPPAAKKND